ncbi:MAG TPA: methylated-DNA--[protein]-cysteine S-methyltransferase [Candidatus Limnocylindrales bacterium]|nr:methylated-DNA--[protein]-cysteine S-methyltransferase [Candidatus Limnocylindrales bacterium]
MTVADVEHPHAHARFVRGAPGPFAIAAVEAPWGPIQVAATADAVVGLSVLSPPDLFASVVARRTGRERTSGAVASPFLDRAAAAVEAFLAGDPMPLDALALDLGDAGDWDRAVLGGVAAVGWGEVTSYGRVARSIGRPGAARAAGGAIGRNPIGLAIPCHRVIAGDGSIGGYGGDWFGSREELLEIKRELLALEGIALPVRHISG